MNQDGKADKMEKLFIFLQKNHIILDFETVKFFMDNSNKLNLIAKSSVLNNK